MKFIFQNIDRAIETSFDAILLMKRMDVDDLSKSGPKKLFDIVSQFMALAGGENGFGQFGQDSFADLLAKAKELFAACGPYQKMAIAERVREIIMIRRKIDVAIAESERKRSPSRYLHPLDESTAWGKTVLALADAFNVLSEQPAAVAVA